MKRFIGRVGVTNSFAQEKIKDLGDFGRALIKAIPEECHPEDAMYRFTFCSFTLECENDVICREILRKAFVDGTGSAEGLAEILVTPYYDDDSFQLMHVIYDNYYGAESYQKLITEMTDAFPLLHAKNAVEVIRRQSYLFAVDAGCGFSTLISSLGDYLRRMKTFTEEGDGVRRCYYECTLGKETGNGFLSPDDFIAKLMDVKDDSNPYTIIGIDVSAYLEGNQTQELRRFLRRLEPYENKFVFAFRVPFLEKKAFDDVKNLFTDLMTLKVIQIPPLSDPVLMEHFWNCLESQGFQPTVSMMDAVFEKIHKEKMDGRFYGYKTVEKMADEAMYLKAVHHAHSAVRNVEEDPEDIGAEQLEGFAEGKKQLTGYAALSELIGMEEITKKIREIIAQVKMAMENEKLERPCIHMRFTGSPGTGKTTVARIIGQIMREEGILRKGGFFEYTGRDLVAEYVGQTAVKTASICRDSYGSVLFIDEAYALYDGEFKSNDFGKEALTTLISEMENHRDDMLVVMAGYTDEMDSLMTANPGLRSRMPRMLHFPNYTMEQLFEIFMFMVKKHFDHSPDLESEAKAYFMGLSQEYLDSKEFANARFVRNLYERTWSKAALRSSLDGTPHVVLTKEDFLAACGEKEFSERLERKKVLGF